MATRRLSIDRGKTAKDITEAAGAAVVTAKMEFTWDLTAGLTRNDIYSGLRQMMEYVKSSKNLPLA